MRFKFTPSFDRSVKTFHGEEKEQIKKTAIETVKVLSCDRMMYKGLGLKRLKGDFWEIRKGLKVRILFRWEKDLIEFVIAGDHDDVKRYLRNI